MVNKWLILVSKISRYIHVVIDLCHIPLVSQVLQGTESRTRKLFFFFKIYLLEKEHMCTCEWGVGDRGTESQADCPVSTGGNAVSISLP